MKLAWIFRNDEEDRLRALWRILGMQAILVLALLILEEYVAAWIAPLLAPPGVLVMDAVSAVFAFSLSAWLAAHLFDHRPFEDLGFHLSWRWGRQLGAGLLLGTVLAALVFAAGLALGLLRVTGVGSGTALALPLLALLVVSASAAYTEELLARGYLLRNLLEGLDFSRSWRRLTAALAVLLSSLLFALPQARAGYGSALALLAFGVLCAAAALRTGELALPIGLHLAWSFCQGLVTGLPGGGSLLRLELSGPAWLVGGAGGLQAGLLGLAAALLGLALLALRRPARSPQSSAAR